MMAKALGSWASRCCRDSRARLIRLSPHREGPLQLKTVTSSGVKRTQIPELSRKNERSSHDMVRIQLAGAYSAFPLRISRTRKHPASRICQGPCQKDRAAKPHRMRMPCTGNASLCLRTIHYPSSSWLSYFRCHRWLVGVPVYHSQRHVMMFPQLRTRPRHLSSQDPTQSLLQDLRTATPIF